MSFLSDKKTKFREACEQGDFQEASRILQEERYNSVSGWGRRNITPLHWACRHGDLDFVKLMIEVYEINPEATLSFQHEETPLHLAAVEGHLDIVKYLTTEAGCNPDIRSYGYRRPPITYACGFADFPPHYADETKVLEVVKYLYRSCNCDPDWVDDFGMTALHNACANRNFPLVKYLTSECECDTSLLDNRGNTVIHFAARQFASLKPQRPASAAVEVIQWLVVHFDCDPEQRDVFNRRPIDYTDDPEVVAELVSYSAQGRKAGMYRKPHSFMSHSNPR